MLVRGESLAKNNQTRCVLISHTIIIQVLIPIPRVSFSSTSTSIHRRLQTYFPARECTYILFLISFVMQGGENAQFDQYKHAP